MPTTPDVVSSGPSRAPRPRMPLGMDAAYNYDCLSYYAVVESVGKSGQEDPSRIAVDYGICLRVAFQCRNGDVECVPEGRSEAFALGLVPVGSLFDVRFRRGRKEYRLHLERSRARTSGQGLPRVRPALTSSSRASSRRSSSCRCSGDRGTFAGRWLRRSHRSPRSSSCSSGERSSRLMAGCPIDVFSTVAHGLAMFRQPEISVAPSGHELAPGRVASTIT